MPQPISAAKALLFGQGVSVWGFVSRIYHMRHFKGWIVPVQTVTLLELDARPPRDWNLRCGVAAADGYGRST